MCEEDPGWQGWDSRWPPVLSWKLPQFVTDRATEIRFLMVKVMCVNMEV